jgi:hypothetical protein
MSDWYWTWGGTSFGFREGDALFTREGVDAGRFDGEEVYGADGAYLGEARSGKLIANRSKQLKRRGSFSPRRRMGRVPFVNHVGTVMLAGYEDFPAPETFR